MGQWELQEACWLRLCLSSGDLCHLTEPQFPRVYQRRTRFLLVLFKSHQRPSEGRSPGAKDCSLRPRCPCAVCPFPESAPRVTGPGLEAAAASSPEVRAALSLHLTAACFSLQVLVVWDETSSKVRNYRIFEKVSRLPHRGRKGTLVWGAEAGGRRLASPDIPSSARPSPTAPFSLRSCVLT